MLPIEVGTATGHDMNHHADDLAALTQHLDLIDADILAFIDA